SRRPGRRRRQRDLLPHGGGSREARPTVRRFRRVDAHVAGPRRSGPTHRAHRHVHDEPRARPRSRPRAGGPGPGDARRMMRLEGAERVLADEALAHYVEMNRINAKKLRLDADLVVVHDVQPAPLVGHRGEGRWVWRCHFDASHAQRRVWSSFRQIINQYDAAVFSLPEFGRRLSVPQYVINPAIDPLSEKNREIGPREVTTILGALRVAQDKALLLQVGAFSRAQDPVGVVNAYRLVKKHYDVRLVLAGTAGDDRESLEVLADLRQAAHHDPDIVVLELPPEAHLQINALQRAATIVLQKSVRVGFQLTAAEAMWKGKPVIAGVGGGLSQQVINDVTGHVVHSVEGA